MSGRWRDAALALLFANLSFARVWSGLVNYSPGESFFFSSPPPLAAYIAVWVNILLWSVAGWIFLGWLRGRRFPAVVVNLLFLLACLFPLNALRELLSTHFVLLRAGLFGFVGARGVEAILVAIVLLLIGTFLVFGRQVRLLAAPALLLTLPLAAWQFGAVAWRLVRRPSGSFADKPLCPMHERLPGTPRIVWIIFDEMDYRLSFPDRPRDLAMPAFDRLSAGALNATHAITPANWTAGSIPALLHGASVRTVRFYGPDHAEYGYADSARPEPWNSGQTIFRTARQLGFNTAVVGWYLPYCRALNEDLASCGWTDMSTQMNSTGEGFGNILINQNRGLVETSLLSPFGQSLTVERHAKRVQTNLQLARAAVSDSRLGLIFLHFPVPHPPSVYDRSRGTLTKSNSPVSGYIDSLALADRILGQLRDDMERSGLWPQTTLLVTADHSYRSAAGFDGKSDPRVPYILKAANQTQPEQFDTQFETVNTRALFESILRGELRTSNYILRWMRATCHARQSGPSVTPAAQALEE